MNREPTMPDEAVLSAYVDGECTDLERSWVEEQLAASVEMRAVLDEVRSARDAVRSLPLRDAPPEFWARLLAVGPDDARSASDALPGEAPADPVLAAGATPVDLAEQRGRRRPARWVGAVAGVAAAAVIAAVVFVPRQDSVTPPVATFTDAHAVRSSLQDDAVSALVPLAVAGGFRR
jgi:anti-sigma factor RsiW